MRKNGGDGFPLAGNGNGGFDFGYNLRRLKQ